MLSKPEEKAYKDLEKIACKCGNVALSIDCFEKMTNTNNYSALLYCEVCDATLYLIMNMD